MKEMFNSFRLIAIVFLMVYASIPAHALHPFPFSGGHNHNHNHGGNATGAPIDGGASLLLAGGAAYAVRRIRKGRQ